MSLQRKNPPAFVYHCVQQQQLRETEISTSLHTEVERQSHLNPREPGREARTLPPPMVSTALASLLGLGPHNSIPFSVFSGTLEISLPQRSNSSRPLSAAQSSARTSPKV